MNTAFYTGASGLSTFQTSLDTIGNNIANSNTVGYKTVRSNFSNLIAEQMYINDQTKPLEGRGVRVSSASLEFTQGTPRTTDNKLDFAILGEGVFAIDHNGKKEYTRNGAFTLSLNGSSSYLTTQDGSFVLDNKGNKISIKTDKETKQPDLTGLVSKIGVYSVSNPEGLLPVSESRFSASETSGDIKALNSSAKTKDLPYRLISGSLEQSGVAIMTEMTNMITAQRAFQFSAKVVETADQVEEIVNNLRK